MPKPLPKYCHHKASGRAYIFVNGKRIYLGPHGSEESHRAYAAELAKWQTAQSDPPKTLTVGQLTVLYYGHAQRHYVKDGKPTSKIHVVRLAIRAVNQECRHLPAAEFSPRKFKAVRDQLIESARYVRTTVNDLMGIIRRMVKWAVSEELLKPEQLTALQAVTDLQAGRCDAKESEAVQPVALTDVEAVVPLIAHPLQGAVAFQLATAARPNEALQLRLGDLDRSGKVWIYRPGSHKTQHRGKHRLILCGPRAQAVILEHAESADPASFVFAVPGSDGRKAYRRDNYALAIRRACQRAFNMPKQLRKLKHDSAQELKDRAKKWCKENVWTPNQLRHTAATEIRKATGKVELSKTILGHSELKTTEIYAERDLAEAVEIMVKIG